MMKRNKAIALGGALCCWIALLAGCASSDLVNVWSDPTFQSPPLKKILVISAGKNPVRRRIWEDAFSLALSKHDVAATASYRLFPDALPDTSEVIQSVQANGFDGVLVTRRLPSETKTQYMQGSVTSDQNVRYDRRNDRFETYYVDIVSAGYLDSTTIDVRTIDVWSTRNHGHMIWSATSETPEPSSILEARPEIIKLVMAELTQQSIIAHKR
jgi:hypothetical protein